MVYKGTVVHYQNGENVLEYHLWTPEWQAMLDKSKFSKDKNEKAYNLLLNCGGDQKRGLHRPAGPRRRRVVPQHHGQETRLTFRTVRTLYTAWGIEFSFPHCFVRICCYFCS